MGTIITCDSRCFCWFKLSFTVKAGVSKTPVLLRFCSTFNLFTLRIVHDHTRRQCYREFQAFASTQGLVIHVLQAHFWNRNENPMLGFN